MRLRTLALILALSGTPAHAAEFVATSQSNVAIEAEHGMYEDQTHELTPSGPTALRARIAIAEYDRTPKWLPAFGFHVQDGDHWISFQIVRRLIDNRSKLILTLSEVAGVNNNAKTVRSKMFTFVPGKAEQFVLLLSWNEGGQVSATVSGNGTEQRHELSLGAPPKTLQITASTGRMEITPLEFGHIK